ncbi:MAG: HU family DNA-binding protein [Candidatus Pelagibacter sp.]
MSVAKSNLIKELANSYPNFLKKDLTRLIDIALYEMVNSLKRGERVELRDVFTIETRVQNARLSRNPKTNQKIFTPKKKKLLFKISKSWSKKINEKK